MGYDCCVLKGRAHLTDSIFLVCNCSVLWPNCGKHLTNSLVLHFFAATRMKVESILQALCKSQDWMKVEKTQQEKTQVSWGIPRAYQCVML